MEIREFAQKISQALEKELGGDYRIEVREVRKNNGIILHGLLILSQGRNIAPTIYLESFLEAYEEGMPFGTVVRKVLAVFQRDMPGMNIDMEFFRFFDKVKDRICYRLVGRERNQELLQEIPHIEFLDLAVCFFYSYQGDTLGEGTILLYNSHVKMWGITTAELVRLAERNTPRLYPWECCSLESVLSQLADQDGEEEGRQRQKEERLQSLPVPESPMSVLSNTKRLHGAACMIYPSVLEGIGARLQKGFYIIPSSIHELILLADTGMGDVESLKDMIAEVNRTQLAPEEILSDNLYYYNFAEKRVNIIF